MVDVRCNLSNKAPRGWLSGACETAALTRRPLWSARKRVANDDRGVAPRAANAGLPQRWARTSTQRRGDVPPHSVHRMCWPVVSMYSESHNSVGRSTGNGKNLCGILPSCCIGSLKNAGQSDLGGSKGLRQGVPLAGRPLLVERFDIEFVAQPVHSRLRRYLDKGVNTGSCGLAQLLRRAERADGLSRLFRFGKGT